MAKVRLDDPLTAEQLRAAMDYNPRTGKFTWRYRQGLRPCVNSARAGTTAGTVQARGYIVIGINGRARLAHRLAFLYMTNSWPPAHVDHINGNRRDNRWVNLRPVTQAENNLNKQAPTHSKTGVKGIHWHKAARKWQAQIVKDGTTHYLGLFHTFEDAQAARITAATRIHGKFARHDYKTKTTNNADLPPLLALLD